MFNNQKKAFTLFELMIVVLLVSIMYYFALSNNFIGLNQNVKKTSLENLKSYLLSFEFEKTVAIKCVDDEEFTCLVFVDGEIVKDLVVENLFKDKPDVYEYTSEQNRIEFNDLRFFDTHEDFNVVFEYGINEDMKSEDLVVDTGEAVYVLNSLYLKPLKYKYLHEVLDGFEDRLSEVKDAF